MDLQANGGNGEAVKVASRNGQAEVVLLVNSSDGFEDCWAPFLELLNTYWPAMDWPILINTETSDYTGLEPNVRATRVALSEDQRLPWSDCLIRAIEQIDSPLLLYMQEDYFVDQPVDDSTVRRAVQIMLDNPEIGHIGLTKHGSHGPFGASSFEGFGVISRSARYRISTQAGLWRPEVLRRYLRSGENGWMFEIFGTWRAQRDDALFLTALADPPRVPAPIDYVHTGIIKGQWHSAMPALFAKHGLDNDFSRRGIYVPSHPLLHKWGVAQKLLRRPGYLVSQIARRFRPW